MSTHWLYYDLKCGLVTPPSLAEVDLVQQLLVSVFTCVVGGLTDSCDISRDPSDNDAGISLNPFTDMEHSTMLCIY